MIVDNGKKIQRKPRLKIPGNLKLKQQGNLKSGEVNSTTETLYEKTGRSTDSKLAEYYVQLFFLS
jgi:hypothetical protein